MLLAECMVCFETLESTKGIYAAPCGHVLHHACWTNCLRTSARCPKCRLPTDLSRLIRLYISYSETEDSTSLQNKIDVLKCELSCKAVDFENAEKQLKAKTYEYQRLLTEIEKLKVVESEWMKTTELLKKTEREMEALKQFKDETLELKKNKAENEKLKEQTFELKKVKEELKRFKDQSVELRKLKAALEQLKKDPKTRNKSKEEMDMIRKYQGVVEGLKQCLHEFDTMKKSNQLVKKLKIYTDDISGNVKNDVKKDPQKYVEMFQEVKKFWNWAEKREDEIKKSPKGCIIQLTNFPPNRKDVTKQDILARMEYYDAEVAFITYTRGDKEAFVRLVASQKRPTDKQTNSEEPGKNPVESEKVLVEPLKIPAEPTKSPAARVVSNLKEGKLRIKNFTVNAVVLEGEEELKFLRRSFDDRDRKTGRVNCELDYFDENEEVGMLEYMMNLVALA